MKDSIIKVKDPIGDKLIENINNCKQILAQESMKLLRTPNPEQQSKLYALLKVLETAEDGIRHHAPSNTDI